MAEGKSLLLPQRVASFIGRAELIQSVLSQLRASDGARVVLAGVAGIGKTAVALEVAHTCLQNFQRLCWLDGSSDTTLEVGMRRILHDLFDQDPPQTLGAVDVVALLATHLRSGGTLLAIDSVPGPSAAVTALLQSISPSSALVMTRKLDWPDAVRVGILTEEEAGRLAAAASDGYLDAAADATRSLVRTAGLTPLSVQLLASSVAAGRDANEAALVKLSEMTSTSELDDQSQLVMMRELLRITLSNAEVGVASRQILSMASHLQPTRIPIPMLLGLALANQDMTGLEVITAAIEELEKLQLIQRDGLICECLPDTGQVFAPLVKLPRLVFDVLQGDQQDVLGADGVVSSQDFLLAFSTFYRPFDAADETFPVAREVAPHADHVLRTWMVRHQQHKLSDVEMEGLYWIAERLTANMMLVMRDNGRATAAAKASVDLAIPLFGKKSPHYANVLRNYAQLLRMDGKVTEAAAMLDEVGAVMRDVEDDKSIDFLLAKMMRAQTIPDMNEQVKQLAEVVETMDAEGHSWHQTFGAMLTAYGEALEALERYDEAAVQYQRTVNVYRHAFSDNYTGLGDALNNLGVCLSSAGNLTEAIRIMHQALEHEGRVIGKHHRTYARKLRNLASTYGDAKQYSKGIPFAEQSVRVMLRLAGLEDNETMSSVSELIWLRCQLVGGDAQSPPAEVMDEIRELIASMVLGSDDDEDNLDDEDSLDDDDDDDDDDDFEDDGEDEEGKKDDGEKEETVEEEHTDQAD